MNRETIENVARAVLYEGYVLYPYRASAVKNRRRFDFGCVYPPAFSQRQSGIDSCMIQAEFLVQGDERTLVEPSARFLHICARTIGRLGGPAGAQPLDTETAYELVDSVEVDGRKYQPWQEAAERRIDVPRLSLIQLVAAAHRQPFRCAPSENLEPLVAADGNVEAVAIRKHAELLGELEISAEPAGAAGLYKIRVCVGNQTPLDENGSRDRDAALMQTLVSTHLMLFVEQGRLISLIDPPEEFRAAAASCQNLGVWPVLVGEAGMSEAMLASPIILYDYPQVAPESPGELFDATEIDEILSLRILTLTAEEKREMSGTDDRARAILERTELLPQEQFEKLHGVLRGLRPL